MERSEFKMGRWDCPVCGSKGILGPETQCLNCGSARPVNVSFYLPDNSETLNDEEQIKKAQAGVDWVCGHCRGHNKAWEKDCSTCSHPREESDTNLKEKIKPPKHNLNSKIQPRKEYFPPTPKKAKPNWKLYGGIIVALLLVFCTVLYVKNEKAYKAEIKELYYKSYVDISYDVVKDFSGWDLPSTAFDVVKEEKIKSYEDVLAGNKEVIKTGKGTQLPNGKANLKVVSQTQSKVADGYKQVADGKETYTVTEKVKVGTEEYECGTIDKGNGYFEKKYCKRDVFENKKVQKERPKFKKEPLYKNVTNYEWTYTELQPIYEKKAIMAPFYTYKNKIRAQRRVEGRFEGQGLQAPYYQLDKEKNEVAGPVRATWFAKAVCIDPVTACPLPSGNELKITEKQYSSYKVGQQLTIKTDYSGKIIDIH
jgi:hypothetical protein